MEMSFFVFLKNVCVNNTVTQLLTYYNRDLEVLDLNFKKKNSRKHCYETESQRSYYIQIQNTISTQKSDCLV